MEFEHSQKASHRAWPGAMPCNFWGRKMGGSGALESQDHTNWGSSPAGLAYTCSSGPCIAQTSGTERTGPHKIQIKEDESA